MKLLMEEKLKALIVDDETDVCFLLSNILSNKNLQASYVNTIEEAKRVLLNESPCIVFLDNHLPDGFGVNFIEEIKRLHPSIKIVMITAHDTVADKEKAFEQGADSFMGKPFTREKIFATLEKLMN